MKKFYLTLFALCGFGKNVIATTTSALITRLERTFDGKPFAFALYSESENEIKVIARCTEDDAEFLIIFVIDENRKIIDVDFTE